MSDARLQEARRSAALGDPGAEARLLVERMRAGTLTRERVELAAYCGSDWARSVVPHVALNPHDPAYATLASLRWPGHLHVMDDHPLDEWTRGLSRWGHEAVMRAALASARAAWLAGPLALDTRPIRAVEACEDYALNGGPIAYVRSAARFCPDPWARLCELVSAAHDGASTDGQRDWWLGLAAGLVGACAAVAGEQPVREAIQSALVAWALGDQ